MPALTGMPQEGSFLLSTMSLVNFFLRVSVPGMAADFISALGFWLQPANSRQKIIIKRMAAKFELITTEPLLKADPPEIRQVNKVNQ